MSVIGASMMSWFWVWPTLVAIGVLLLGYLAYLLLSAHRTSPPAAGPGSARRMLDERSARAEIDEPVDQRRRADPR